MNIKKLLESKVVKNGTWLFVLQFANTVLPLLTILYVTRILGAAGYGQFSVAYNWITYAQVFVEYGYTMNGARKVAISDGLNSDDRLWRGIVCSRAILFLFSLVVLNIICLAHGDPEQYKNTMILMLIVCSVIFQMNWLFQGKQQMQFITIVNVIGRVLSVLLIFLLVKDSSQVSLYCFLYAFTFIFSSLLGLVVAIKRFQIRPKLASKSEIVEELKDGWSLFTSSAISRVFGSIGITILGIYASKSTVGAYSAVYKIPYMLNLCFAPIGQALFPHISQKYTKSPAEATVLVRKVMLFVAGSFGVICASIMILRNWLVPILFGSEYVSYSNLILILAPQLILGIINNFLGVQTLVAAGFKDKYSHCVIANIMVLLGSNLLLCPRLNAYGTAFSALIAEAVLCVLLIIHCKKYVWQNRSLA